MERNEIYTPASQQITELLNLGNVGNKLKQNLAKLDGQIPQRELSIAEATFILIGVILKGPDNIMNTLQGLGKETIKGQYNSDYVDFEEYYEIRGNISYTSDNNQRVYLNTGTYGDQSEGQTFFSFNVKRNTMHFSETGDRTDTSGTGGTQTSKFSDILPNFGYGKSFYLTVNGNYSN